MKDLPPEISRRDPRKAAAKGTKPQGKKHPQIRHQEILQGTAEYSRFLEAYGTVLGQKTRTISLLGRKSPARILHTLLGYEVQAGYKRIQCPDLVTARYVRLFSELGFRSIRLPYDPTVTARLIPEFEAMEKALARHIHGLFPGDSNMRKYVTRKVYEIIRQQVGSL